MVSAATQNADRAILLVGHAPDVGPELAGRLRAAYPSWNVTSRDTFLAAIAEAASRPYRVVLAGIDPSLPQMRNAVAGLRDAAGSGARLLLVCRPETEPFARDAAAAGADDYLVLPLETSELDEALGIPRAASFRRLALAPAPAASMQELSHLAELLAHLSDRPRAVIDRLASMVRAALSAKGATVVVEGAVAIDGQAVNQPILLAPLEGPEGVLGQISLAERVEGAYTPGDAEKLKHYARIAAHVLHAASKQRQWRDLSLTDANSGLPNRRFLYEQLDEILAKAAAEHFPVTLLIFDVDNFKMYNDRFGHDAGDRIIRIVGDLFREHCREQDVITRFGGDEFAVVFWDPQGPRVAGSKHPYSALDVLDRVQQAMKKQDLSSLGDATGITLTISGGLATYPWDAAARNDLINRADEALLAAKRAGKNRIFQIGQA